MRESLQGTNGLSVIASQHSSQFPRSSFHQMQQNRKRLVVSKSTFSNLHTYRNAVPTGDRKKKSIF